MHESISTQPETTNAHTIAATPPRSTQPIPTRPPRTHHARAPRAAAAVLLALTALSPNTRANPLADHAPSSPTPPTTLPTLDFNADGHDDLLVLLPRLHPIDTHEHAPVATGRVEVHCTQQLQPILTLLSDQPNDLFGISAASIGDINADGIPDLIVGAPYANTPPTTSPTTPPRSEHTIQSADPAPTPPAGRIDLFCGATAQRLRSISAPGVALLGRTVAGIGDATGDGVPDFAASAFALTTNAPPTERVIIFCGHNAQPVRIIDTNQPADGFGDSITPLADLDADGLADIAITAPRASIHNTPDARGTVHIVLGQPPALQPLPQSIADIAFTRIDADPTLIDFARFIAPGRAIPLSSITPQPTAHAPHHATPQPSADDEPIATIVILSLRLDQSTRAPRWHADTREALTGWPIDHIDFLPFHLPADLTRDLRITQRDLRAVIDALGQPSPTLPATNHPIAFLPHGPFHPDLNNDGSIDTLDLQQVTDHYAHHHPLLDRLASPGHAMHFALESLRRDSWARRADDQPCTMPIRTHGWPGLRIWCHNLPNQPNTSHWPTTWPGTTPPPAPNAPNPADPPAHDSEGIGSSCPCPGAFGIGCWCCCFGNWCPGCPTDPPFDCTNPLCASSGPGGGFTDPGGETPPGNNPPGDPPNGCPADDDCDGIPNPVDCDSNAAINPTCCNPSGGGSQGSGMHPQNQDDDCDGIPNWADCNSECYIGNAQTDCECQDGDDDGLPNQNECGASGSECGPSQFIVCPDIRVDSNNDGAIDEDDEDIENDDPSLASPGMIIFVPHDIADQPVLRSASMTIPAEDGAWLLGYDETMLRVHWNQDREPEAVDRAATFWQSNDCNASTEPFVRAGTRYCVNSLPGTVWIEAISPSLAAGDQTIVLVWIPEYNHEAVCQPLPTIDIVRVTPAILEVHDLRHWGPQAPPNDSAPPSITNPNLDTAEAFTNNSTVDGAITDGTSICLVRVRPSVHNVAGMTVRIRRIEGDTVLATAPGVVGTMTAVPRSYDPTVNTGSWSANPPTLPLLPTPHPLPGGASSSADFDTGLAFFVPPEAYTDPLHHPGAQQTLNSEETTELSISVHLGIDSDSVAKQPFMLRRPPIILVHGLMGAGLLFDGVDQRDYWSQTLYNEHEGRPVMTRLYVVGYESKNVKGYDNKNGEIHAVIQTAMNHYRGGIDDSPRHAISRGFNGLRYAATRVDGIGHSMGGQLLRVYVTNLSGPPVNPRGGLITQNPPWGAYNWDPLLFSRGTGGAFNYLRDDNWGAGEIRRIIAVGSPFKGSPIANHLEPYLHGVGQAAGFFLPGGPVHIALLATVPDMAAKLWPGGGSYDPPTAVSDLSTGSAAQLLLESSPNYSVLHRAVGWYPLSGVALNTPDEEPIAAIGMDLLIKTAKALSGAGGININDFEPLNPTTSDLVVNRWSQQNAAGPNDYPNSLFPTHPGHVHTGNFPGGVPVPQTRSVSMADHLHPLHQPVRSINQLLGGPRTHFTQGDFW